MGSLVVWGIVHVVALGRASDAILSENYRSIIAAEIMVNALERQDSGVLLMFAGDSDGGIACVREQDLVFLEWLGVARENVTFPGEDDIVRTISADYETYRTRVGVLIED
ncbi:MAG: hypothetical protein R6W77_12910 [Trueperaceae bacterium]